MTNPSKNVRNRRMTKARLFASMMATDGAHLADTMTALAAAGVRGWHWDIMDGHFVPNLTFGPDVVKACRAHSSLEFDVHLMVTDPVQWVLPFIEAGAECIDVHVESGNAARAAIELIRQKKCRAGLVLNPKTTFDDVPAEIWGLVDRVLLMSVEPGFGGQKFIDITPKIAALRQKFPTLEIAVDGGINAENAGFIRAAGADILISGSGLMRGGAPYEARVTAMCGGAA